MNKSIAPLLALLLFATMLAPLAQAEGQTLFTPSADKPWGYDFIEDVDGHIPGTQPSGSAVFNADQDNFAYLAEEISTTKLVTGVTFDVQPDADGFASGFAAFLSTEAVFAKGNGKDSGSFENGVKLWLKESGNNWEWKVRQIVGGSETQLATGTVAGGQNLWATFELILDARAGEVIMTYEGTEKARESISSQLHKTVKSQWYVGFGFSNVYPGPLTFLKMTGGSGEVTDRDPQPPAITNLACSHEGKLREGQTPTISATVTDDWDGVPASVQGVYTLNNGVETVVGATYESGTHSATFPAATEGTTYHIWLRATDSDGLTTDSGKCFWTVAGTDGSGGTTREADLTNVGGGGGGGEEEVQSASNLLLVAGLFAGAGMALFLLLRRKAGKMAMSVLLGSMAIAAVFLVFGLFDGLRDAVTGTNPAMAAMVAVVGVAGVYVWRL